jgi:uncharacterized OB-fold protein
MERRKTIDDYYIPEKGSSIETIDGRDYLIANDAMYTFYKRTKGEFSPFFLALRDEKRLLGCRCTVCGLVRVPPFLTHCPECDFAPTELIEVEQGGVMNSTPPITYFATSLFQHMAPYGRGRVIFRGADTALSVNLYTTTGILVPGIITKGTEVKLVFRDDRIGEMTDVFCIPSSELTSEQIGKKGLQESEINWEAPREPALAPPGEEERRRYQAALAEIKSLIEDMNRTDAAKKAIKDWKRAIQVKSRGGVFALLIDDGEISLVEELLPAPDFTMVSEDVTVLLDGFAYRGAITDAVIAKKIWISKNMEFNTIFKLDRMARFLVRARKDMA